MQRRSKNAALELKLLPHKNNVAILDKRDDFTVTQLSRLYRSSKEGIRILTH